MESLRNPTQQTCGYHVNPEYRWKFLLFDLFGRVPLYGLTARANTNAMNAPLRAGLTTRMPDRNDDCVRLIRLRVTVPGRPRLVHRGMNTKA
jgi:hypothetical protein